MSVVLFGSLAVILTVLTLQVVTQPGSDVNLGSDTFKVGGARTLERRIRADDYPLLFQDLQDKSIDLFVDHHRGKPLDQGWRAIEAHAPGAPRRCQLDWTGSRYRDPCTGTTYPSSGKGLRRFKATVIDGVVTIDFTEVTQAGE